MIGRVFVSVSLVAVAGAATVAIAQGRAGPTATYWMTAETNSGMAAAMGGGGMSMVGAMMGRGNRQGFVHNLHLQLGSGPRPAGEPSAEHLPPPGLQAGTSLPLVTPRNAPAGTPSGLPSNIERPRGRMLIYWGCGERARPGQPVVIDFAALTSGRVPPAFANANIRPMTPPSPATSPVYGEWPNQRSQKQVPAAGSLVGDHVVRGNYTPEIRFSLNANQDFLAPVVLTANDVSATGSVPVMWRPVPGARAWLVTAMGAAQNGDFIMWSSSETQIAAMGLDHLDEAVLNRLVQQRALLPASADRCTVPVEVARAGPQSMLGVTAFGGQANFSHPVRPARAPASWRPEWQVKLRTKSAYMGMLGMDMDAMMRGGRSDDDEPQQPQSKKSRLKRGLGKLLGQ